MSSYIMTQEEYLAHYGVPGMKWGKRKAVQAAGIAGRQYVRGARNVRKIQDGIKGGIKKLDTPKVRAGLALTGIAAVGIGAMAVQNAIRKSGSVKSSTLNMAPLPKADIAAIMERAASRGISTQSLLGDMTDSTNRLVARTASAMNLKNAWTDPNTVYDF
jgi:hypothetical protein